MSGRSRGLSGTSHNHAFKCTELFRGTLNKIIGNLSKYIIKTSLMIWISTRVSVITIYSADITTWALALAKAEPQQQTRVAFSIVYWCKKNKQTKKAHVQYKHFVGIRLVTNLFTLNTFFYCHVAACHLLKLPVTHVYVPSPFVHCSL